MKLILQPEGSALCGQACVAMAAGVSLERAIDAVGHEGGTGTKEVVEALRDLGVCCADRLRRISRRRPSWPKRGLIAIGRPATEHGHKERQHWMLVWDGVIYDPGGSWPNGYKDWRMSSYLEIFPCKRKP